MKDRLRFLPRYVGIAAAARLFALLAIGLPAFLHHDWQATLWSTLPLGGVWAGATAVSVLAPRVPAMPALAVEGSLVAVVVASSLTQGHGLHPSVLALTPFLAGLRRGPRGVIEVVAAEIIVLTLFVIVLGGGAPDGDQGAEILTSLGLGLGLGLVASFLRSVQEDPDDLLTPYRDARALIMRLLDLSDHLGPGLDPVSIADRIAARFGEGLPATAVTVYVERYGEFVPLLDSPAAGGLGSRRVLVDRALSTMLPVFADDQAALPLATDAGIAGVVVGLLEAGRDDDDLAGELRQLERDLAPEALRLDTAQLYARVREAATSEERQRLAREVHDGVAQGVASLGYLVDALAADATDPAQRDGLRVLRTSISDLVGEIRRTVFSLRNEATAHQRLGARIQMAADNLHAASAMSIKVQIEESAERLLHEVESDLLRIAQEAMNNAVKHSRASVVRVELRVDAPRATLAVRDDGVGLQAGKPDSQGLRIMRERAARIGGTIEISNTADGAAVVVRLGGSPRSITPVNGGR